MGGLFSISGPFRPSRRVRDGLVVFTVVIGPSTRCSRAGRVLRREQHEALPHACSYVHPLQQSLSHRGQQDFAVRRLPIGSGGTALTIESFPAGDEGRSALWIWGSVWSALNRRVLPEYGFPCSTNLDLALEDENDWSARASRASTKRGNCSAPRSSGRRPSSRRWLSLYETRARPSPCRRTTCRRRRRATRACASTRRPFPSKNTHL